MTYEILRTELAEAREGSRYLDGEFWRATHDYILEHRESNVAKSYCVVANFIDDNGKACKEYDWFCWEEAFPNTSGVLKYTSSIDAVIASIPEGWTRHVDATVPEAGICVGLSYPGWKGQVTGDHLSEPIATCIAILKAMEKDEEE